MKLLIALGITLLLLGCTGVPSIESAGNAAADYKALVSKAKTAEFKVSLKTTGGVLDGSTADYAQKSGKYKNAGATGNFYTDFQTKTFVYCNTQGSCEEQEYSEKQIASQQPGIFELQIYSLAEAKGLKPKVESIQGKKILGVDTKCFKISIKLREDLDETTYIECFDENGVLLYSESGEMKSTATAYSKTITEKEVTPPQTNTDEEQTLEGELAQPREEEEKQTPTPKPVKKPITTPTITPTSTVTPTSEPTPESSELTIEQKAAVQECIDAAIDFNKKYPRASAGPSYSNVLLKAVLIPVKFPNEFKSVESIKANTPKLEAEFASSAETLKQTYAGIVADYNTLTTSKQLGTVLQNMFNVFGTNAKRTCKPL